MVCWSRSWLRIQTSPREACCCTFRLCPSRGKSSARRTRCAWKSTLASPFASVAGEAAVRCSTRCPSWPSLALGTTTRVSSTTICETFVSSPFRAVRPNSKSTEALTEGIDGPRLSAFGRDQLGNGFAHGRADAGRRIFEIVQVRTHGEPGGAFTEHHDLAHEGKYHRFGARRNRVKHGFESVSQRAKGKFFRVRIWSWQGRTAGGGSPHIAARRRLPVEAHSSLPSATCGRFSVTFCRRALKARWRP